MQTTRLGLDTLGELDNGYARLVIDKAFADLARDIEARGDDGKKRSVVIRIDCKPKDGLILTNVKARATLPDQQVQQTAMQLKADGKGLFLEFRPDNAENPRQRTLDDADGSDE